MSEHTVEGQSVRRLERSRDDRMLAGVCGGLARYFEIHPAFYRVGFVVLTLIGGAGILVYLAALLVIPDEGHEESIATETLRQSRDRPWPLIGLGLLGLAGIVLLSRVTLWPDGDAAWILLLLAGGAILFFARRSAPPAPPVAGTDEQTTAVAAAPAKKRHILRTILIVLGSLFVVALTAAAIFVAIFPVHLSHGVGRKTLAPAGVAALERTYRLGIGELDLDLTKLRLPVGETRVNARVDYGDVDIVVPRGVAVRAYGKARLGYVNVFGDEDDSRNADERARAVGARVLVVDARVQVGSVWIRTAPTMTRHAAPKFSRRADDRVIAGVCAGIAQALAVDATLIRLVFALLALAGGAGILLYLALWAYSASRRPLWVGLLVVGAGALLLHAVGLSNRSVAAVALIAGGLALAWRRGGFRSDAPLSWAGLLIAACGTVLLFDSGRPGAALLAPGAIAGALLLIAGPWLWRLALERDAERSARIRSEERSEVAARVHDSVLQTLALIQRHATEPRRVAALARRQERELRGWLYADRPLGDESASLVAALSGAAAEVEELYGVRVEIASSGDCPVDDAAGALVLAAREAMTNAAKFAGVEEIDVYLEVADDGIAAFVRDRGKGFNRAKVPARRRGLAESIEGRMERAGGRATFTSAPGVGTEIELRLPRGPS